VHGTARKKDPARGLAGLKMGEETQASWMKKDMGLCEGAHIRLAGALLFWVCRNEATEKFP